MNLGCDETGLFSEAVLFTCKDSYLCFLFLEDVTLILH